MRKAIAAGFAFTEQQVLEQAQQRQWLDGAVCVAVWLIHETVFVANVGLNNASWTVAVSLAALH